MEILIGRLRTYHEAGDLPTESVRRILSRLGSVTRHFDGLWNLRVDQQRFIVMGNNGLWQVLFRDDRANVLEVNSNGVSYVVLDRLDNRYPVLPIGPDGVLQLLVNVPAQVNVTQAVIRLPKAGRRVILLQALAAFVSEHGSLSSEETEAFRTVADIVNAGLNITAENGGLRRSGAEILGIPLE